MPPKASPMQRNINELLPTWSVVQTKQQRLWQTTFCLLIDFWFKFNYLKEIIPKLAFSFGARNWKIFSSSSRYFCVRLSGDKVEWSCFFGSEGRLFFGGALFVCLMLLERLSTEYFWVILESINLLNCIYLIALNGCGSLAGHLVFLFSFFGVFGANWNGLF